MSVGKFAPRKSPAGPVVSVADTFVGPEIVKMTVNFDGELRRRIKARALVEGRSMRDVMEDAAVAYLDRVGGL